MLPFKNRLVKKKDFEKVQKIGRFCSCGKIALKYTENELKETRIGFSVGLKFSKLAVARNQAKRMVREIFRSKLKNIRAGMDVIVIIRKREGEKVKSQELLKETEEALKRSGLIK